MSALCVSVDGISLKRIILEFLIIESSAGYRT